MLPDEAMVSSPTEDCLFRATAGAITKKGGNAEDKTEPVFHLGLENTLLAYKDDNK
jgi:hypothetical protein